MNKAVLSIVIIALCSFAYAEENPEGSDAQASMVPRESLYSYDRNDMPNIFFFPRESARWDGSKVTMREWYMLTDTQKERFISEYLKELQGEYKMSIDVAGMDYLKALNIFSAYSNDKTMREPSTKFIDILLSGQGKITVKDRPNSAYPTTSSSTN
ncbi:MAG: hypothetical protein KKH77_05150 [Candidatus Omnitrophica bacterium]|nr:hypothetical protein [Candidatus Omnitrophota bacterium]MBU0880652.1 hypothetical protein [Candidatus Omnitrophota bacterium]MBU0895181.1 hypothetical protein [Candidatus Omnitrophota bacterium]MBU1038440.1 hypothetical protein [Candidatus Omnitrophota bacterium]MBU1808253.1 hypothetical protein [Candidatus Omnitrophota bacterium]